MRTRLCRAVLLLAALVPLASATAQNPRPAGWKVRYDRPGADSTKLSFESMSPGWHITSGPAAIFYEPGKVGNGDFTAETVIHLFKPESPHAEAFGLFVGGKDLEQAGQTYTYFVIRNDGKYLIKQRTGTTTKDIVPWTESAAIKLYTGEGTSVANTLTVKAGAKDVKFLINGTEVSVKPRADVAPDGTVGLRVNHNLNLHVAKLTVE